MSEINISRNEQKALESINAVELDRLIEQAIRDELLDDLHRLPLRSCGSYVSTKLHYFEQALMKHRLAKAPQKRTETENTLRRVGRDLSFAVESMKHRMETEKEEGQFFYVDDQIMPPHHFTEQLRVRVSYQWRRSVNDMWTFGNITFVHNVDLRPDYTVPLPKRKPSAAKQEQDLQNRLYQTWEYLMKIALYSVRDYFKEGGDGSTIPKIFHTPTRELNNYSTRFWHQQP